MSDVANTTEGGEADGFRRVTEILKSVGLTTNYEFVDKAVLARASLRSKNVHNALDSYFKGGMDHHLLDDEERRAFEYALAFMRDSGFEYVDSEIELVSPRLKAKGHPDLIVRRPSDGRLGIIDWKWVAALDADYLRYQIAGGYRTLWEENGEPIAFAFGVQIKPERKTYKASANLLDDPRAVRAKAVFEAAALIQEDEALLDCLRTAGRPYLKAMATVAAELHGMRTR